MAYVEVTSRSWGSRIMQSVGGALIGGAMFLAAFPLLFWNEGRAVQTMKSLEEAQGLVVTVSSDNVDEKNEQKLVHTSGQADSHDVLKDPAFGVSAKAIRLERDAEMYQWKENQHSETRKKLGGGEETTTTYTYERAWADHLIDSSAFKEDGHDNPRAMKYQPASFEARNVTLGAFHLIPAQIAKIGGAEALTVTASSLENAPRRARPLEDGVVYIGESADSPKIGDERISFRVVRPGPVSVVAQQVGRSFQAFQSKAGDALLLVEDGIRGSAEMFQKAHDENTMMTWILRVLGFGAMFFGLMMVFKPLSVIGDFIPFIGSMIGAGMGLFAFLVSAALSLLTVSIAWMFYRPLLGIPLLLLSCGAIYLVFKRGRKKKAEQIAQVPLSRAA